MYLFDLKHLKSYRFMKQLGDLFDFYLLNNGYATGFSLKWIIQ